MSTTRTTAARAAHPPVGGGPVGSSLATTAAFASEGPTFEPTTRRCGRRHFDLGFWNDIFRKPVFCGAVKTRRYAGVIATSVALLVGAVSAAQTDSKVPAEAASKKPAKTPLEKGMTAETVRKLIGEPNEIKKLKSPEGKAETWVYRREIGVRFIDVAAGTRQVPAYVGVGGTDGMGTRTEIIYRKKRVIIYRVTSLLMFNDRLVLAKQVDEQSEHYE